MSETTVYIGAAALLIIGGSLLWTGLKNRPVRWPLLVLLAAVCVFAAARPGLVLGLFDSSASREQVQEQLDALIGAPDSEVGQVIAFVEEVEPGLRDKLATMVQEAMQQPDPRGYMSQQGFALGTTLGPKVLHRLSAASDESFDALLDAVAPVLARLPEGKEDCQALLSGKVPDIDAMIPDTAAFGQELWELLLRMIAEARAKPAPGAMGADEIAFLNDQMSAWVANLSNDDLAFLMAAAGGDASAVMNGQLCHVMKSMIAYLDALPSPQGGRVLRLLFLAQQG